MSEDTAESLQQCIELTDFLKEAFRMNGNCTIDFKDINLKRAPVFTLTDSKRETFKVVLLTDGVEKRLKET